MPEKTREQLEAELQELKNKMDNMFDGDYVKQLRDEAAKHRTQKQEFRSKLESIGDVDKDELNEFKQWKQDTARQHYEKLIKEGKFDVIENQYKQKIDELTRDIQTKEQYYEGKVKELQKNFDTTLVSRELTDLASKAGALNPAVVSKLLSDRVKVERDEQGKMTLKVFGEDGQPMKDNKANPISLGGFIDHLKTDENYSFMFAGGKEGSGSRTSNLKTKDGKNPFSKKNWNLTEQTRLFNEDRQMFDLLKEQANNE